MTLQLSDGCGDATKTSTRFEVTVNGQACHVYGRTGTTEGAVTDFWADLDEFEVSAARFGTDETVTVRVSMVDGAAFPSGIVRAVVFPRELYDDAWALDGGALVLALPVRAKVRIEVSATSAWSEESRREALYVCADQLTTAPTVNGTTVILYNGTQSEAAAGTTLVFAGGEVTDLVNDGAFQAKKFPVRAGARVYLSRDSWVIGSFTFEDGAGSVVQGCRIYGPGNLSGEWITRAEVLALPTFAEQYAHGLVTTLVSNDIGDNEVSDITMWHSPWYHIAGGVKTSYDTLLLSPWHPNTDGYHLISTTGDETWRVQYCAAWTGDDCCALPPWARNAIVGDVDGTGGANLFSNSGANLFIVGYQPESYDLDYGYSKRVGLNYIRPVATYYHLEDEDEGGSIINAWLDGSKTADTIGYFRYTFDELVLEVPDGDRMNSALFNIATNPMPEWDGPDLSRDQYGTTGAWVIRNIRSNSVPTNPSLLYGESRTRGPAGLVLENIVTGGIRWDIRNLSEFAEIGDNVSDVTLDGRAVA